MKVHIDAARCQGPPGRCYAVAPELFEPDDLGDGQVIGDGTLAAADLDQARRAVANCPERAIHQIEDEMRRARRMNRGGPTN